MISGFIVKKKSMKSVFTPEGKRIAVTTCLATPLKVTAVVGEKNVQVAFGSKKRLDKSVASRLAKNKLEITPQHFKEFTLTGEQKPEIGQDIAFDSVYSVGDTIKVTGISKGRGFAGVIKRYGFQRQPVSGGQSDRVRAPGAIGAQTPGKVLKGKKMPGHYGAKTATVLNLNVYAFNKDTNELLISGPIPGHFNSWVSIAK